MKTAKLSLVVLLLLTVGASGQSYYLTDTLWITVTFYDYHSDGTNPNFDGGSCGRKPGLVRDSIDADRKPVMLKSVTKCPTDRLYEWFRPDSTPTGAFDPGRGLWTGLVPFGGTGDEFVEPDFDSAYDMATVVIYDSLPFELADSATGTYSFYRDNQNQFWWLDGRGFGNEGRTHNAAFTMELHHAGIFQGGEYFDFRGDDDVWAFINGHLVLDLGGTGAEVQDDIDLNYLAATRPELGLQIGKPFQFDFFYAERDYKQSNIGIMTNILTPTPLDSIALHVEPDDTVQAGDMVTAWAEVFNDTGGVQRGLGNRITWGFVDNGGNHDSTLSSTNGDTIFFVPTEAYATVILEGALFDTVTGQVLRDSAVIYVLPGPAHHALIESTATITGARLVNDQELDTLRIDTAQASGLVYAVVRDRYGNFVDYSQVTTWAITSGAGTVLQSVTGQDGAVGRGTITKVGNSGVGVVRATDQPTALWDVVPVRVVNGPPVANNDVYNVLEDNTLVVPSAGWPSVLGNDTDPFPGTVLTAALVSTVTSGSLAFNNDGSFTYVPELDFNGTVQFTYRASDGQLTSNTATVTIMVGESNDPPQALDDAYTTNEDQARTVTAPGILANDGDNDGDPLTAVLVAGVDPAKGTLVLNANGSFIFTPAANVNGTATFTYQASDGVLRSPVATVTISILPVNDQPSAGGEAYTTLEDVALNVGAAVGVLANDNDIDGNPLQAILVSGPDTTVRGSVTLAVDGSFVYRPKANYNGTFTFTYRATDGTLSDTATVTITVRAVNDAPVAYNDVFTAWEDTTLTVSAPGVLANDVDRDNASITASLVEGIDASEGTLTFNADGSFTYVPAANFNGAVVFRYQVSDGTANSGVATVVIQVRAVNDAPVARDDAYSTSDTVTLNVAAPGVLSNDGDIDGDGLSATLLTDPATINGSVTLNFDGSLVYVPVRDSAGTVVLTYVVSDGGRADTARVRIFVAAENDPPDAGGDTTFFVDEDDTLKVNVPGLLAQATDPDPGDTLRTVLVQGLDPSEGTLIFDSTGAFTFIPSANMNGQVTFTYQVTDGELSSPPATVTIVVGSVNDRPVAANDAYTTQEDTRLTIPAPGLPGVLRNDQDIDGDALSAVLVTNVPVARGSVSLQPGGGFVYSPAPNLSGIASFTYRATDGTDTSAAATVTITVTAVNDSPLVADIPDQEVERGAPFSALDLDNFVTDIDDSVKNVAWTASASTRLTVVIDPATHVLTVTVKDPNWVGSETVTFTATDPGGTSRSDQATFTVVSPGTIPAPVTDTTTGTRTGNRLAMNLRVPGYGSAVVYYTYSTDGSRPAAPPASGGDSLVGSGLISFGSFAGDSTVVTIRARAVEYPYTGSSVAEFTYLVSFPQLPGPVASPAAGEHQTTELGVGLSVPGHSDAAIYYTTDGTDPSTSATGIPYSAGNQIAMSYATDPTTVLRIYAEKSAYKSSRATLTFTLNPSTLPLPVATPAGHVFIVDTVRVALAAVGVDSAIIRYTLDGSRPDSTSPVYTGFIPITANTTLKAGLFKEGSLPGPVLTEVYTKSTPTALEIYPSLTATVPYPATVTATAGTVMGLVARVLDQRDSVMSAFAGAGAPITWEIEEIAGAAPGTLSATSGAVSSFYPVNAYTTARITATFAKGGVTVTEHIVVVIGPGAAYRLWLESDYRRDISPNEPNPIDTVRLSSSRVEQDLYAVLRDSLGNYVSASTTTSWLPVTGAVATVQPGQAGIGQGVAVKGAGFGVVTAVAENAGLNLLFPRDSAVIKVMPYWYDSLRIVLADDPDSTIDSVSINTNQAIALYVYGHRDDGYVPGWEAIKGDWQIVDRALDFRISSAPREAHTWLLSPTDTASGRVRVSLGDDSLVVPDTVFVRFLAGPPTRAKFEILTPADSLVAGQPITTVVRLFNEDAKPVYGTWCFPGNGGDFAIYDDILGSNGRPEPTVRVDGATDTLDEQGVSVRQCFGEGAVDTVAFTLYYAPLSPDSLHILSTRLGTIAATTSPFRLQPGPLDTIVLESLGGAVLDTVNLSAPLGDIVIVAIGYDQYGNPRGREIADWTQSGTLHAIARPDNTPQIYYDTKGITENESGYITAEVQLKDGTVVRDSVFVTVRGKDATLVSAITRDLDGDGLLDAIELRYDKAIATPDQSWSVTDGVNMTYRSYETGVVRFTADSIVAAGGRETDSVFIVHFSQDGTMDTIPQTAWTPALTVKGLPGATDTAGAASVDGAGPVIWRVVKYTSSDGNKQRDRVVVWFSEPIQQGDGAPFSFAMPPREVFDVWVDSGGTLVKADGVFEGIRGFTEVEGNKVTFLMSNGGDLTDNHLLSINTENGLVADAAGRNPPSAVNKPTRAKILGSVGHAVVGPNPMTPVFFFPDGDRVLISRDPDEAYRWVRQHGGATISLPMMLPSDKRTRATGAMAVYDAVGNLVYTRSSQTDVIPHYLWDTDWTGGESRQLVFYWNGITDRNTRAAAGTYRVVLNLNVNGMLRRYVQNIGIGR